MKNSKQSKIPSHSMSSFTDKQSISLIENILTSHKRVMPRLSSIDKWPNIDGFLDVQDCNNLVVGRLFVQAKTLPFNHNYKLACPISFFSNCEINPTVLLGVDNKNKKVYWLYFDSGVINKLDLKKNNYKKTITFKKEQFFDENKRDYIFAWERIVKDNRTKFQNYDELKTAYEILSQSSNKALGKVNQDFVKLHIFLDTLNNLMEREFLVVKNIFYPNTWKIGIACYEYKSSLLSYALYPVNLNKNDVQIKQVDKSLHELLVKQGLGFSAHFVENPIESQPKAYAKKIIEPKVLCLLENKLLNHTGSNFLAKEFIFAFVDKFHIQLGLPKKETYKLHELELAFYKHLPLWVEEAAKFMASVIKRSGKEGLKDYPVWGIMEKGGQAYFDPAFMICGIMEDKIKEVARIVSERLKDEKVKLQNWQMGNRELPFGIFDGFFTFLKSTQQKEISRPYKPKDNSRLSIGPLVYNLFSKKDAEYNLEIFFKHLSNAYNQILDNNFPLLKNELSLFGNADKIIITFSLKDQYKTGQDFPTYQMFYLKTKNGGGAQSIDIVTGKTAEKFKNLDGRKKVIDYNKKKYNIVPGRAGILDFIYEDIPMLGFIYETLNYKLKDYFEN